MFIPEGNCIVLIGHNSSTFDTPILLRRSDENFRSKLSNLNVYFGDSQILVKHLLKDKHPALQLSESASCKSNQSALYSHLFNEEFEAHDALEDVKALEKILFHSTLQLNKEKLVNCSGVIGVEQAIASMTYLDRRHEILQTFSGRLFDPRDDSGAIKQSMAQKIAGSGLSYSHLKELYLKFGTKGLLAILSMLLPKTQRGNLVSLEQSVFSMPLQTTFRKHFRKKNSSFGSIVGKL